MAATFVRENTPAGASTAATTGAVTITAPTAGDVLVAAVAFGSSTSGAQISSIASTGATWTRVGQSPYNTNATGTNRQEIWVASPPGTGTSVTITFSATAKWAADITEWSGLTGALSSAAPTAQTGSGATASGTSTTSSTALPAVPVGDLVIGAMNLSRSNASTDFSATSGSPGARTALTWKNSGGVTAQNVGMQALYAVVAATEAESFSWTTAAAWNYTFAVVALQGTLSYPLGYAPAGPAGADAVYRM